MKKKGLGSRLRSLFGGSFGDEESFEELEDTLIEADIGARAAMDIVDRLREASRKERASSRDDLLELLRRELVAVVKEAEFRLDPGALNVVLVLGVNGVGKTTTIAKLATHFRETGQAESICLAAGDTFRAAAVEQLSIHAERLGVRIVKQTSGSDSGAVIFDAVQSARTRGDRLVLADTAGRMHTRKHLVEELSKIDRIVSGRAPDAVYRRLLVIDATTGQNGLQQAEVFSQAVPIDGIVLSKYDSTAKGGILVPISQQLGIPTVFYGTGEKYTDIHPFHADDYVKDLLDLS
ncbi:MAG: signal recognition particle-docking protein FtsY [Spirochaetota bacterium]